MTTAMSTQEVAALQTQELETLREDGLIKPESVVEYARDPGTALHSAFEWDDEKASQEYRLLQARRLIRVRVTLLPRTGKAFRANVSLKDDRKQPGGGYRRTLDVLSDEDRRRQFLNQAWSDYQQWRNKYEVLLGEEEAIAESMEALGAELEGLATQ